MAGYEGLETLRSFIDNEEADAIPLILYVMGVIVGGALYTLFFIYIAPSFYGLIPASVYRVLFLGILYFIPLLILFIGILSMIKAGLKRYGFGGGMF